MKCEDARKLLSEYVDGEASAADARAVKAHLEVCGACRAEAEALRGLSRALGGVKTLRAPALAVERARKAVRAEAERMRRREAWAPVVFAAAAAVLVVAAIAFNHWGGLALPEKAAAYRHAVRDSIAAPAAAFAAKAAERTKSLEGTLPDKSLLVKVAGGAAALFAAWMALMEGMGSGRLARQFSTR